MILAIILFCMAVITWMTGIFLIVSVIVDKEEHAEVSVCLSILFVFGVIGFAFSIYPLFNIVQNKIITHETPTFVIKTNNIVSAAYIQDSTCLVQLNSDSASYWNSTNIMVKKLSGDNIFGISLRPVYEIVDMKNQ
jgi:hypothetical protein